MTLKISFLIKNNMIKLDLSFTQFELKLNKIIEWGRGDHIAYSVSTKAIE